MSKRDKPEEETARTIISRTLHAPVTTHDDGSRPSMYDLSIQLPDGEVGAVEVTMAADREAVQLSRLVNQEKRWIEPMLEAAWHVSALPQASGKRLFAELPQLLAEMEERGASPFISIEHDQGNPDPWMKRAFELRLESVNRSDTTDYPGAIYISVEGRELAGYVPQTGDAVAEWIGDFLAGEERADIRKKLGLADARERHAFVWVPLFHTAPWAVLGALTASPVPLPTKPPQLPKEVTHVWVMSTWGERSGLRWSRTAGWSRFDDERESSSASRTT
ncbi:MAG: hypothetical protein ABI323_03745 [Solirubrobacteraceae bacterium]